MKQCFLSSQKFILRIIGSLVWPVQILVDDSFVAIAN